MNKAKIYDLLSQMAVVFGKIEKQERLQFYTIELNEYNFETVKIALRCIARKKTFFPFILCAGLLLVMVSSQVLSHFNCGKRYNCKTNANDPKTHNHARLWPTF